MITLSSTTQGEVTNNLRRIAEQLEEHSRDDGLPPAERYLHRRYAAFARELAKRRGFCGKLAAVSVTLDTMVDGFPTGIWSLLDSYSFPSKPPYDLRIWADLLVRARLGSGFFWPGVVAAGDLVKRVLGIPMEVQFVYSGTLQQAEKSADRFPVDRLARIRAPLGATKQQVEGSLKDALRGSLWAFLREVRPLSREGLLPGFGARLLVLERMPRVVDSFWVSLPRGRDRRVLLAEVASRLMDPLKEVAGMTAGQGRPPDGVEDHAEWWAKVVLDGVTPEDIAKEVMGDDPDPIEFEETIEKTLRRLGVKLRTK